MRLVLKTALVLIAYLVAADIVGVLVCTFFDISPFRGNSVALPYAIWFVLGIFCGLFAYNTAGQWSSIKGEAADWTALPDAGLTGLGVLATAIAIVLGLCLFFYRIYWSQGVAGEYYVPDSASHSITFFVAVLGGMVLGRFALMPTPDKPG